MEQPQLLLVAIRFWKSIFWRENVLKNEDQLSYTFRCFSPTSQVLCSSFTCSITLCYTFYVFFRRFFLHIIYKLHYLAITFSLKRRAVYISLSISTFLLRLSVARAVINFLLFLLVLDSQQLVLYFSPIGWSQFQSSSATRGQRQIPNDV